MRGGLDGDKRGLASRKKCSMDGDCQEGACTATICQLASFSDELVNGSETDVYCGVVAPR